MTVPRFRLDEQAALVTGAASGIALGLAASGADVAGIRVNTISPGHTATPMITRPEVADRVVRFEADTRSAGWRR